MKGLKTRHSRHALPTIALLSATCVGDGCVDTARFGYARVGFVARFMALEGGIPGHDAVSARLNALGPANLQAALRQMLGD